ncbi:hypothetical protein OG211_31420 [Streptomyces niveus]|uniref:hypothetical protein n=1 Tax=Streptomyces niveus TaxID=193462 RepID=UPI0038655FC2|nr:hypothetical protein OG211_31420 [Streptomyces niveus]
MDPWLRRTPRALALLAACAPACLAALVLGTAAADQVLGAIGLLEAGANDPSLGLGILLALVALAPFLLGVITAAFARRLGRPWGPALNVGAGTVLVAGVIALLAALPVAVAVT